MPAAVFVNVIAGGALTGLVYGLMALGLSVIFGVVRIVNFAHGEMTLVAMYASFVLFKLLGLDPLISLLPVAGLLFLLGYALQAGLINPFVARPEHEQFILIVGVGLVLVNLLLMIFGPDARHVDLPYAYDSVALGPLLLDKVRLYAAGVALVISAALFAFFRGTRTGTAIRACADNLAGAAVVGLDYRRLYALTFGIGAASAGAAGALLILIFDATPSAGPTYTMMAFIIVIVGGLGSMAGALLAGMLIGVSEALAGLLIDPSMKSMVSFALLVLVLVVRPEGLLGREEPVRMRRLPLGLSLAGGVLLLLAPAVLDRYLVSILIIVFYTAYLGQAWNVMMGFAGLLSIGHALYIGLGAYVAGGLFVHFGVPALIGIVPGMLAAAAAGGAIGWLGFRFRIGGVYFALLTIAFAEFARIAFDHIMWFGASGGLYLPVDAGSRFDVLRLRGGVAMYYYVGLALVVGGFLLCRFLLRSRLGHYWLAIREDEEAARALGIDVLRCRLAATMISAAMTAVGGTFYAFYDNVLFPENLLAIGRSIDLMLAPIVGGLGTLAGPIVGAFVLTPLAELLLAGTRALAIEKPGLDLVIHGLIMIVIIRTLPGGIWPWLRRRFGASPAAGRTVIQTRRR